MQTSIKSIIASGSLAAVILAACACSPRRVPTVTVDELLEDRVALDGVLMKCNQDHSKSRNEPECVNARIATQRLAKRNEPAEEARRAQEFERSRERWRLAQEKQREAQEAKNPKVDAYHLPVVPVETAPPPSAARAAPPPGGMNPSVVREPYP
ncbi:MAG: hypothetical protein NVS9B2_03230 [Steroidobacteraceae bacterium]